MAGGRRGRPFHSCRPVRRMTLLRSDDYSCMSRQVNRGVRRGVPVGPRYVVRLMFEWGGGCLWGGNRATNEAFDVGPIEDRLPLSPDTRRRLEALSSWHDGALNWEYPPDPSPWPPA